MAEIHISAAYVRHPPEQANGASIPQSLGQPSEDWSADATRKVWELLRTPQTVESVARVLTQDRATDRQVCARRVEALFARWVDEDLIQLSPDS